MCEISSDAERVGDVEDLFVGQWTKFTLCTVHGSLIVSLHKAVTSEVQIRPAHASSIVFGECICHMSVGARL